MTDEDWMRVAIGLAEQAQQEGEVPVGAVIVKDGQQIAAGYNRPIHLHDPTAHAEIAAIRAAALRVENYRLLDTTLYVTLEPCAMCIGAIMHARVSRLVFGAYDPRAGAVTSVFQVADEKRINHRLEYQGGVLAATCGDMLRAFFRQKR